MAEQEDEKSPLLERDEDSYETLRHRGETHNARESTWTEASTDRPTHPLCKPSPKTTEADQIVCIFVVAFDTRSGNVIEWCMPEDMDLDGVEFKAMVSGSHTLTTDFVYFRKDNMYGLACFENMPVESEIERGARMKSVGILATSYTLLYRHMQFLETQVRHQLETPGKYTQLLAFYEDKKGLLPSSSVMSDGCAVVSPASTPSSSSEAFLDMKITHPAGCFSQFTRFFGEQIFILWKYALLKRRILFFSPPPIGVIKFYTHIVRYICLDIKYSYMFIHCLKICHTCWTYSVHTWLPMFKNMSYLLCWTYSDHIVHYGSLPSHLCLCVFKSNIWQM
ncbi:hypothetical protein ACJMK2_010219 [Sinanodonta woodiana]|uniref:DENN domain-containing protein 11 n=1 Tax=Sinanodonta woodiana TaxID=1069815 RepID=A0ABD3VHM6_SINWO